MKNSSNILCLSSSVTGPSCSMWLAKPIAKYVITFTDNRILTFGSKAFDFFVGCVHVCVTLVHVFKIRIAIFLFLFFCNFLS